MEIESFLTFIFRSFYRRKKAQPTELNKPRFKWFPKYEVPIVLPQKLIASADYSDELELILGQIGFEINYWTKKAIHFKRGKSWGDFSLKVIRINVSIPTPLTENSTMLVEVADVCLFDTGDLWLLTNELDELLKTTFSTNLPSDHTS